MGIKDLYKLLKKHAPGTISTSRFSKMTGLRVAVDISVFLYKYVRSAGPKRWINTFILFLCALKKSGVKAICIFDGPNPPIEKKAEQEKRRTEQQKIILRMKEAKRIYDIIRNKYLQEERPIEEKLQKEIQILIHVKPTEDATNYSDPKDVMTTLKMLIDKDEKATIPITSEMADMAKELIEYMGLAWLQSDGEAETLCSYLAVKQEVDAVITEDTDVLAYGSPIMISKIELVSGDANVTILILDEILETLGLNYEEFRDLCIMLKCDYNQRAEIPPKKKGGKPVGIGEHRAFNLIKEYRSIENISPLLVDEKPLNYKRCRQLFTIPDEIKDAVVPYNGDLMDEELREFIQKNRCNITFDYIKQCWEPTKLIFQSSDTAVDDESEDFGAEYVK